MVSRELKIACIMGAIMILICIFVTAFTSDKNVTKDLNVYMLHEPDKENEQRGYVECVNNKVLLTSIYDEIKKMDKLDNNDAMQSNRRINGDYKIVYKGRYYAFDRENEQNIIYIEGEQYFYKFESPIYQYVEDMCKS